MNKPIFLVIYSTLFIPSFATATLHSNVFAIEEGRRVTVSLSAETWKAREVQRTDLESYQTLFADERVMSLFGSGTTRSAEYVERRMVDHWLPRFEGGSPHGPLTVHTSSEDPGVDPFIGFIIAGGGDGPGVSEVGYAYMPGHWGKGYGTSILRSVVTEWAPEVRRIGRGHGLDEREDASVIEGFKCFEGEALSRLDATASPDNPGSWKILTKTGFTAAATNVSSPDAYILDLDASEDEVLGRLKSLFDATQTDSSLEPGKRYRIIDPHGNLQTVSFKIQYDCFKYHFEYLLPGAV